MSTDFNRSIAHVPDESNVWAQNVPTFPGYITYAFIIPILAAFGVVSNFINAVVFMRPRMTPSAFTYLAAMSWMDCVSCVLILFTALSQSLFYKNNGWHHYDIQLQIPVFGITTGAANLILMLVTLDRLIYIKSSSNCPPAFCSRKIARSVVCGLLFIATICNVPYFFIFEEMDNGEFKPTDFYHSVYYIAHNWINFVLLGLFPAIFLMVANGIMLSVIRKWSTAKHLPKKGTGSGTTNSGRCDRRRFHYQTQLTMTIVAVVFLFYIGELPSYLTSRKTAISLLFAGDISGSESKELETFRIIISVLNAFQLSFNIIIYATFNPAFVNEMFYCLRKISDKCQIIFGINFISRKFSKRKEITDTGCEVKSNQQIMSIEVGNVNICESLPASSCECNSEIIAEISCHPVETLNNQVADDNDIFKYKMSRKRTKSCADTGLWICKKLEKRNQRCSLPYPSF